MACHYCDLAVLSLHQRRCVRCGTIIRGGVSGVRFKQPCGNKNGLPWRHPYMQHKHHGICALNCPRLGVNYATWWETGTATSAVTSAVFSEN